MSGVDVDGLEFDPDAHVYRLNGETLPGVTQCLEPYTGLEFVNWELLRRAAEFGTHVHAACHLFNEERLDWSSLDPPLVPYVQAWERFLDESGAVVVHSELRVASRRWKYAGTLDTIADWRRRRSLIDIKSGAVPRTVGPQTAAYAEAFQEMTGRRVERRYCVQLKANGTYRLVPLEEAADFSIFMSALNIHRWYGSKK